MHGDSESQLPRRKDPNLWRLPLIESFEAVRVRYKQPRKHMVRGELIILDEGVELRIHTDAPIPIRALSPALFVGDEQVVENEITGPNDYRFFVLNEEKLKPGAPVRLGWVAAMQPPLAKEAREEEVFRYQRPTRDVIE